MHACIASFDNETYVTLKGFFLALAFVHKAVYMIQHLKNSSIKVYWINNHYSWLGFLRSGVSNSEFGPDDFEVFPNQHPYDFVIFLKHLHRSPGTLQDVKKENHAILITACDESEVMACACYKQIVCATK